MEFHDYIVNYALQNDKDIQKKTTLREEFYELRGGPKEDVPKKGEFFKHQDLFTRYLRQYDRVMNIHETGTGKTGSIIDAAEMFRRENIGIKRVVIIEPGKPTLDDFKSQIVKFNPEMYDDYSNVPEFIRKRNITKKIERWYSLETYEAFSNKISKYSTTQMKNIYSDTLFFLDEAHRMRNYGDSDSEDENIYINLWKLLHTVERVKIVIGTATPLVNSVNDFVPLFNLLLDEKQQLPSKKWDYSNITIKQLEPFLRGKISFVRSLDTGVKVNYKGSKINYEHVYEKPVEQESLPIPYIEKYINENGDIVEAEEPQQVNNFTTIERFKSDMDITLLGMVNSDGQPTIQNKAYTTTTEMKQSFELASRESSVFVFPDGSWGSKGFNKYVKEEEEEFKFRNDDIKKFLTVNGNLSLKQLYELSSKFWFYINTELEASKKSKPGNSFCYIEFVKGSGAILLGLMLELFGFENFTRKASVFSRQGSTLTMQKTFKPKPRFAIITAKTQNTENILQLFNSKDNMNGKYLQIIIASKVARDGINLANTVRGYIMTPGWHESGMYQALSRFIRATSHVMLMEKNKNVKIDVYKLATCVNNKVFGRNIGIAKIRDNSIDVYNYIKSEEKDLYNRLILKGMKEVAFDAILNYDRNHRETDVPNSKQTDYGEKFPPVWSGSVEIDESSITKNTKKLLFYQDNINRLDALFKEKLSTFSLITIDEVLEYTRENQIDDYYVYLYMKRNLDNLTIIDKFGIKREVIFKGRIFYVESDNNYHYTLSETNFLPEIEIRSVQESDSFYQDFRDKSKDEIEKYIRDEMWKTDAKGRPDKPYNEISQLRFMKIMEESVVRVRDGSTNVLDNTIYELFHHYINKSDYPYSKIEEVKEAYETITTKAGRTAGKYSRTKLSKLNFGKLDTGKDTVYYHFFAPVLETNNVANIFKREDNPVRILRSNSNEFVDADENFELPIFQAYYKQDIQQWTNRYQAVIQGTTLQTYGTFSRDNKFRIINPPFEKSKGIVCGTNKNDSMSILNNITLTTDNIGLLKRIIPEKTSVLNKALDSDKEYLEKILFPRKYDNINDLRTVWYWEMISTGSSSRQLCVYLERYLTEKNKMIRLL